MADNLFGGFADGLGQGFQIGQMMYNRQQQLGDQTNAGKALFDPRNQSLLSFAQPGQAGAPPSMAPSVAPGVASVPRVQPAQPGVGGSTGSGIPTERMAAAPQQRYGASGMPSQQDVASYITQSAQKRGIDPQVALAVWKSEGGNSRMGADGDGGSSDGPFQLHVGGVAKGGNSVGGLGDEYQRVTGNSIHDMSKWQQQVDFALDKAKQGGWSPWHGWKGDPRAGLGGPQNPGAGQGGSSGSGMPAQQAQQPPTGQAPAAGQIPQTTPALTAAVKMVSTSLPNGSPAEKFRAMQNIYPLLDKESQMVYKEQTLALRSQINDMHQALNEAKFDEHAAHDKAEEADKAAKLELNKARFAQHGLEFDAKNQQAMQRIQHAEQVLEYLRKKGETQQANDLQKLIERKRHNYELEKQGWVQKRINVDNDQGSRADKDSRMDEIDDAVDTSDLDTAMGKANQTTGPEHEDAPQSGPPPARPAAAQQGDAKTVTSKAEYDALPPGTPFMYNGKRLVKGQQ